MALNPILLFYRGLVPILNTFVDQVTNSDLELAGSVIDHACMADFFDMRERTMLSQTDNTAVL